MASKVQVAKFSVHDFNEASILGPISSGSRNMEEDEVLVRLNDNSSKNRVEILEQLIITVKRNSGQLPYPDPLSIYKGLAQALADSHWEIRLKCIQLLNEIIPHAGEDLDGYMAPVLNKLIPNIGDSKVTVKRAVIQTLHVYMKYTNNVPRLLRAIVQIGLESDDSKVRKETVSALPVILTKDFAHENFYEVIQSLTKKLLDTSVEDNLQDSSLFTLGKIENLVGEREFNNYLQKLSPPLRKYYAKLAHRNENGVNSTMTPRLSAAPSPAVDTVRTTPFSRNEPARNAPFSRNDCDNAMNGSMQNGRHATYMDSYEFGIIPSHVMNHINDQENFRTRAQAVEDLKRIMRDLTDYDVANILMPHMIPFISFLNNLLDDSNFKITTVTLEILCSLVEKLGQNVKHFLRPLISALAKRMCDNKVVIRQAVMRVAIKMMQSYAPKPVLSVIAENMNLRHKNSRVRQETINVIIAALLTFPSYDFDLPSICHLVGPTLTDSKRQVRQAALECFSVLAQAMGSGRLQPLVQAVDQVELNTEGEGLMGAVQARLARRQLPRLNSDGLVEYATPIPSSATQRTPPTMTYGADMDWIMSVGNMGSARSVRSDPHMELESVTGSARSTPAVPDTPTPAPRRFMSAGRGRNKFPWEEDRDERSKAYDAMPGSAPVQGVEDIGPPKPRTTWISDNEGSPDLRRVPKRRSTVVGINAGDEAMDGGSYKQIYQNKLRRQQAAGTKSTSYSGSDSGDLLIKDIKENGFHRSDFKTTPRPFLDPISADQVSANLGEDAKQDEDETPVHLKPTLARGSATRRLSPKVPPISSSSSPSERYPREDDSDSAYAASLEGTIENEGQSEMLNSLRKIRNSASKKKAEKIFEKLEKQSSRQSLESSPPLSDNLEESGVFSTYSRRDDGEFGKKKSKKVESPFESRPKLARDNSIKKKNRDGLESEEMKNGTIHRDSHYNPASGVTFRENRNSDVQIVGRGYSDDSSSTLGESKSNQQLNNKARDRRRLTKGSTLSPLGVASLHSYGAIELDDDKVPSQDNIALVGKGMFDTPPTTTEYPVSNSQSNDRLDRKSLRNEKAVPSGVIGVGVKQNGDFYGDSNVDEDTEEDALNLSMAKTLRETIAQKQKQKQEDLEFRRAEKEKKKQEHEEKVKKEKERQQEKLRRLSSAESLGLESLSISGSNSNTASPTKGNQPKPPPPAITPRKKIKTTNEPISSQPMATMTHSPVESDNPEDWKPFKDPENELRKAQKKIAQDEWEGKMEGINIIRRLAVHHPNTLSSQLHPVVLAMGAEVKNLRSQVSRLAIVCFSDMFLSLKKHMDPDLDMAARILLAKSGETNGFIRADVDSALKSMMESVTPQRALVAIIAAGATHKNTAVRKTTAQFLVPLVEKMGPGRILSGIKDITDKVLPTAAQFAADSSQETRYFGKKILYMLMSHQDFDKILSKYLTGNALRNTQDVVENLRLKGLGDVPSETSSARSRRSGQGSRTGSSVRGGSASSSAESINNNINNTPVPKRRALVRTDENTMEEIKSMISEMSDHDWKERHKGIANFLEMCENNPNAVSTHIIKIFDKFLPRLQDSNSKVNLYALQVMLQIIPLLKESLGNVVNMAVGNVAPNLSSRNREIHSTATEILEALIDYLDPSLLIQPFANQAQSASARSKPNMVEKVAYLVDRVYPRKQKQVVLHVLPLLWHLLGATNSSGAVQGGSSDLRTAMTALVGVLNKHMGPSLVDKASSDPNVTTRHLQLLQDLIDRS